MFSQCDDGGDSWMGRHDISHGQGNLYTNRISDTSWGFDQNNEMVKVWLKREKNRLAATKCREKKKEKLNSLLGKAENLERFNNDLRQECYRLEAEKTYLVKMLMDRAAEDIQYLDMDSEHVSVPEENMSSAPGAGLDVSNIMWTHSENIDS